MTPKEFFELAGPARFSQFSVPNTFQQFLRVDPYRYAFFLIFSSNTIIYRPVSGDWTASNGIAVTTGSTVTFTLRDHGTLVNAAWEATQGAPGGIIQVCEMSYAIEGREIVGLDDLSTMSDVERELVRQAVKIRNGKHVKVRRQ